ncbi:hypothetical protein KKH23_00050 [Patescibacteria group bacterium]|nr:hypothetical protein [Patescibacteria group bacterium]MBU0776979.1 hypothetical protein [Patescibacteria group bacterium]MBU0845585.1 hypothetical protein [Patescibacteria group bacterium]MBU0923008.1 hypothetical protein [Patescibacteria group bacterium]MBU1066336.1 hypothetical protein [Patescibacteria group bacterium]
MFQTIRCYTASLLKPHLCRTYPEREAKTAVEDAIIIAITASSKRLLVRFLALSSELDNIAKTYIISEITKESENTTSKTKAQVETSGSGNFLYKWIDAVAITISAITANNMRFLSTLLPPYR